MEEPESIIEIEKSEENTFKKEQGSVSINFI